MKILLHLFIITVCLPTSLFAQPVTKAAEEAAYARGKEYAKILENKVAGKTIAEASVLVGNAINEQMETDKIGGAYILIAVKSKAINLIETQKVITKENKIIIKALSSYIVKNYQLVHDVRGRQPELPWPTTLPRPDVFGKKSKTEVLKASAAFTTLINEGAALYKEKEYEKAILKFDAAIKEGAERPEGYYNLALCYHNLEQYQKSIAAYQNAIARYGNNTNSKVNAFYNIGTLQHKLAAYDSALQNYNNAIKLDPTNGRLYTGRFYTNCKLGKTAEAENDKQKANANGYTFDGVCSQNIDKDLTDRLKNAADLLNAKKFDEAIVLYNKIINQYPNNFTAYANRGISYYWKKNYNEALVNFKKAATINPKNTGNLIYIAYIYFDQGKYADAITAANNCIASDSTYMEAYELKAKACLKLKDYTEAISTYSKMISLGNKAAITFANRAAAYANTNNATAALKDYEEALRIDPKNMFILEDRMNFFKNEKRYEEALKDVNRLIEMDPEYPDYYLEKGLIYHNQKQYEEALLNYKTAIKLDSLFVKAYSNMGAVLYKLKRYDESLLSLETAISLDKKNSYSLYYKGLNFNALKKYNEAIQVFDAALILKPDYFDALFQKSYCLGELGEYAKAKAVVSSYLSKNPQSTFAYQNRGFYNKQLKLYDEAIADYTKWIGLEPKNAEAYKGRASVYCQKNLKALAQADEQKAISLGGTVSNPCR